MVLEIIGKGVFSILDDIIMAEEVVAFEVVGGKNIVRSVLHGSKLLKLASQLFSEEFKRWLFSQLVGLEKIEKVTLLGQELQMIVDIGELLELFLGEEVFDDVMNEGFGMFDHISILYC